MPARATRGAQAAPTTRRAAIYPRVSDPYGDRKRQPTAERQQETPLDQQESACRAYAAEHGYSVDEAHVYREAHTGVELWERPRLTALREAIRRREIDVVIAYSIDRLTRDPVHLGVLISEADHAGVAIEFVAEPLDTSPEGQLIAYVRGYAAKIEHAKIRDRTMRGRRARAEAGKLLPGARPLYGYRRTADNAAYEVDEATAPIVRRMFSASATGQTLRAIAAALTADGIPTPMHAARVAGTGRATARNPYWYASTVRVVLTNPTYTGRAYGLRYVLVRGKDGTKSMRLRPADQHISLPDGTVPPLVDDALFAAVQQRLRLNQEHASRNNRRPEETLLRGGYARCGYCGYAMEAHRGRKPEYSVYRCSHASEVRGACTGPSMTVHLLDAAVWQRVETLLTHPELVASELTRMQANDPSTADLEAVERQLTIVAREQRILVDNLARVQGAAADLVAAKINMLEQQRAQYASEREAILVRAKAWQQAQQRLGDVEAWCRSVAANLTTLTYTERRLALDALGVQVHVWSKDHTPRYEIRASIPLDAAIANKSHS